MWWQLRWATLRLTYIVYDCHTCFLLCRGSRGHFSQGWVETPSYDEVCSGNTGHTEAVQVFYDPKKVEYRDLLGLLFSRINPTTINGQGNDRGTQYRTGVYTHTPEDRKVAGEVFTAIAAKYTEPIAMELKDAVVFWPAEDYHQQYLSKVGN